MMSDTTLQDIQLLMTTSFGDKKRLLGRKLLFQFLHRIGQRLHLLLLLADFFLSPMEMIVIDWIAWH